MDQDIAKLTGSATTKFSALGAVVTKLGGIFTAA